jgi:membrane fusion protein, multidrug efflux system
MRTTYITAIIIALLLAAWLASGVLGGEETPNPATLAEQNREQSRVDEDAAPTKVRVSVLEATPQQRLVKVRGKTENKRTVDVKVELAGTVVDRPVDRGSLVAKGDLLCQLSVEDRQAALTEAQAALAQAQIEYSGALSLKEKGYNSDTAIAGAKARLAAAEANISRRNLDLQKIAVRAPFGGIVEDVHQEIGDYVVPGANCATVVDMDPMLLVGRVSEQDVLNLSIGQLATGHLRSGETVAGPVTFIGQLTDPTTRTYAVEIELANPDRALRSGITTEIHIPVQTVLAQKISPALISLDDNGEIGIRTVNENNVVEFHHIEIMADANDGIWVHGLPNRAGVITVGQELVTAGERVDPVFQNNGTLKAETPEPAEAKVVNPRSSLSSANALPI